LNEKPTYFVEFRDNHLLSTLVGPHDQHLRRIEKRLGVLLPLRGNRIGIIGPEPEATHARQTLELLYKKIAKNAPIDISEVDAALRLVSSTEHFDAQDSEAHTTPSIATRKRLVAPRTPRQAQYIEAIQNYDMVFGVGPAGTGKTYLAVAVGVSMLLAGQIDRIILTRPAVEAGEHLGFLPGDMKEKVDPYLRPLYDALNDMLPSDQVLKRISNGEIEIAPLAFMRGRTLANAFVILDEAQNTTPVQMKMFLTRLGQNSRMVITGDLTQIDLPGGVHSGLRDAMLTLKNVDDIRFIEFDETDVVRHPLVSKIVKAYDQLESKRDGRA
jgi:phosphate starvation-inducible PhoH-like protein